MVETIFKGSERGFLEVIDIPLAIIKDDFTIVDFNIHFLNMTGVTDSSKGKDIRDLGLFKDLKEALTEALKRDVRLTSHIHYGRNTYEIRIHKNLKINLYGEENLHGLYLIDITRYIDIEKELIKKNRELMIVNSLSSIFISTGFHDEIYMNILQRCLLIGDFGLGWILARMPGESGEDGFVLKSHKDISLALQKEIIKGKLDHILERVELPMYVFEDEELENIDAFKMEGIRFLVAIPLISSGNKIGYIFLGNRGQRIFDLEIASILSLIGNNVSLIIEKLRLFGEIQRLSITDSLTGLFNRRFFYDALDREIERVKRYASLFSIILIDIDDFKKINDVYGHLVGDKVLAGIAEIMKKLLRKSDIISRYGGEEFIVLLPNTPKEESFSIAMRLKQEIAETLFEVDNCVCSVTISGGITSCPDDFIDADRLLSAADKSMYKAKAMGKNRIVVFKKGEE